MKLSLTKFHFVFALIPFCIVPLLLIISLAPTFAITAPPATVQVQLTTQERTEIKPNSVIKLAALDEKERTTAINRGVPTKGQPWQPDTTFITKALAVILGLLLFGAAYWNYALRREVLNRTLSLQRELEQRQRIENKLSILAEELEDRVLERTKELESEVQERTLAERLAKSSERKFKALFQNAGDSIYIVTMAGNIIAVNDQASLELGYSLEELLKMKVADIDGVDQPENSEQYFHKLVEKEATSFEILHKRKDGTTFPVEVNARLIDYDSQPAMLGIARNLTERKQAEEERQILMENLNQSQKIESIGRLAGGIAHDFNNLLTPIIGYADIIKKDLAEDNPNSEKVSRIIQAAERAKTLIEQLLSFGREQILEMKPIDLNHELSLFYEILRRTIREDIDLQLHLSQQSYCICADRNRLNQIVMNLVVNAQEALSGNGIITIETAPAILDKEYVRQYPGLKAGHYLMLAVTDNGCGMDHDALTHLFEPFYTRKKFEEGTDLGLATVYGLVKQHGGNIWAHSEPGKGSALKVFFPIVDAAPDVDLEPVSPPLLLKGDGRTVLLVEDNEMVRTLVYDLLSSHGFNMIVADGPKQALELIKGQHLDLLISDVVMPDMDGPELHQHLLESRQGLKALFISGYTNTVVVHHGLQEGSANFIQKPFAINDLAKKIEEILDTPELI